MLNKRGKRRLGMVARLLGWNGETSVVCEDGTESVLDNSVTSPELLQECQRAAHTDEDGDLPLHIAVVHENVGVVHKLMYMMSVAKVPLDHYNNLRQTPLHLAVITKNDAITQKLLQGGANPALADRNGLTAVHLAVQHKTRACLETIVLETRLDLDIDAKNYEGFTALHMAVIANQADFVDFLIDAGASLDMLDGKSGRTPLFHAAENKQFNIASMLLQAGASVNIANYSGSTPVQAANGRGHTELVALLVKYGADVSNAVKDSEARRDDPNRWVVTQNMAQVKATVRENTLKRQRRKQQQLKDLATQRSPDKRTVQHLLKDRRTSEEMTVTPVSEAIVAPPSAETMNSDPRLHFQQFTANPIGVASNKQNLIELQKALLEKIAPTTIPSPTEPIDLTDDSEVITEQPTVAKRPALTIDPKCITVPTKKLRLSDSNDSVERNQNAVTSSLVSVSNGTAPILTVSGHHITTNSPHRITTAIPHHISHNVTTGSVSSPQIISSSQQNTVRLPHEINHIENENPRLSCTSTTNIQSGLPSETPQTEHLRQCPGSVTYPSVSAATSYIHQMSPSHTELAKPQTHTPSSEQTENKHSFSVKRSFSQSMVTSHSTPMTPGDQNEKQSQQANLSPMSNSAVSTTRGSRSDHMDTAEPSGVNKENQSADSTKAVDKDINGQSNDLHSNNENKSVSDSNNEINTQNNMQKLDAINVKDSLNNTVTLYEHVGGDNVKKDVSFVKQAETFFENRLFNDKNDLNKETVEDKAIQPSATETGDNIVANSAHITGDKNKIKQVFLESKEDSLEIKDNLKDKSKNEMSDNISSNVNLKDVSPDKDNIDNIKDNIDNIKDNINNIDNIEDNIDNIKDNIRDCSVTQHQSTLCQSDPVFGVNSDNVAAHQREITMETDTGSGSGRECFDGSTMTDVSSTQTTTEIKSATDDAGSCQSTADENAGSSESGASEIKSIPMTESSQSETTTDFRTLSGNTISKPTAECESEVMQESTETITDSGNLVKKIHLKSPTTSSSNVQTTEDTTESSDREFVDRCSTSQNITVSIHNVSSSAKSPPSADLGNQRDDTDVKQACSDHKVNQPSISEVEDSKLESSDHKISENTSQNDDISSQSLKEGIMCENIEVSKVSKLNEESVSESLTLKKDFVSEDCLSIKESSASLIQLPDSSLESDKIPAENFQNLVIETDKLESADIVKQPGDNSAKTLQSVPTDKNNEIFENENNVKLSEDSQTLDSGTSSLLSDTSMQELKHSESSIVSATEVEDRKNLPTTSAKHSPKSQQQNISEIIPQIEQEKVQNLSVEKQDCSNNDESPTKSVPDNSLSTIEKGNPSESGGVAMETENLDDEDDYPELTDENIIEFNEGNPVEITMSDGTTCVVMSTTSVESDSEGQGQGSDSEGQSSSQGHENQTESHSS